MFLARMHIHDRGFNDIPGVTDCIIALLNAMRLNGQIVGREYAIVKVDNEYDAYILIPEQESLENIHHNTHVSQAIQKLQDTSDATLSIFILGFDPSSAMVCEHYRATSFIMYTSDIIIESPLRCGDCFSPVPLYRIPSTYDDEYQDVINWQSDYDSCDRLWLSSGPLEKSAHRQLLLVNSSLHKSGLRIRHRIEFSTKTPTYYHLLHDSANDKVADNRCPKCKKPWKLEQWWLGRFQYKCDVCRIVS
jgi:predicted  nucleic acid-binding Zn ribbon protein